MNLLLWVFWIQSVQDRKRENFVSVLMLELIEISFFFLRIIQKVSFLIGLWLLWLWCFDGFLILKEALALWASWSFQFSLNPLSNPPETIYLHPSFRLYYCFKIFPYLPSFSINSFEKISFSNDWLEYSLIIYKRLKSFFFLAKFVWIGWTQCLQHWKTCLSWYWSHWYMRSMFL